MLSSQTQTKTKTSEYFHSYFNNLFTKKRSLTKLEHDLIPQVQANWQNILQNTITNRIQAETSIKDCYRHSGLSIPNILWTDHPLAVVKILIDRPYLLDVAGIIINQIWQSELKIQQSIDSASALHIFTNIDPQHIIKTPKGSVPISQITNAADEGICQRLNELVMNRINDLCYTTSIEQTIPTPLQDYRIGDLSYFDYFMRIGVDIPQIQPAIDLAKSCGWCWTFEGLAILTPKPSKIRIDRHGKVLGIIYNNVDILSESEQSS
jgi:hypothetical protein